MNTTKPKITWEAVCTSCGQIAGEGATIAALAEYATCPGCGAATEPHKQRGKRDTRPRGALAPDKYLDDQQWEKLRAHARILAKTRPCKRSKTDLLVVEILGLSGLRAAELCALTIADTPGHHGKLALHVRDGKGHVSRAVHISSALAKRIAEYVAEYRADLEPDAPLIAGVYGGPVKYRVVYEKIKRIGDGAGVKVRCHMLRHTYATRLYGVENDLRFVQDQLGHTNPATTMVYAKTAAESCRRQADKMQ